MSFLKSGLDPESLVIPGEDPEKLRILIQDFSTCWRPQDARERELVDELAIDNWRLKRLRIAEQQIWIGAIDDKRKCRSHCDHTETGDAYLWRVKVLGFMQRQVNSIKRNLRDTARELQRLQSARQKEESLPVQQLTSAAAPKIKVAQQSQFVPGQDPQYHPNPAENECLLSPREQREAAFWEKNRKRDS